MLTDDELQLAAHAYALRHDERDTDLWFRPEDHLFLAACRLWKRGYFTRRWSGDDLVYRCSDQMMTAQGLSELSAGESPN